MDCCETDGFKRLPDIRGEPPLAKPVGRRGVLKGTALAAGTAPLLAGGMVKGAAKTIQLAFCSNLLCAPPFEVTRVSGYFRDEGLDVQLVYMRGSTAATQALVGGALDYAATSFDDVLQAFNRGADIKRFYSTGRLPLVALAIAPNRVAEINSFKDLEGRTVGLVARGGRSEAQTLFLMKKAGADGKKVQFAVLGPNIYEPVRLGQVDAAWVGEPALTLLVKEATSSWASRSEPRRSRPGVTRCGRSSAPSKKGFRGSRASSRRRSRRRCRSSSWPAPTPHS